MSKMRRILALVLVMAMTFSMLPIFAAAEEAVGEVAAVETVEAPAAEAPVVEAPAADAPAAEVPAVDAPVAEIPAVEDVAEIPAETPADVPVVEAIETVATETVAALQDIESDVTNDDVAKLVIYDANNIAIKETGYTNLKSAYEAAGLVDGVCEVVVLKDVFMVGASDSYVAGAISGAARSTDKYLSYNTVNTTDTEQTIKGFWFNLNGHTVTVRCKNSANNNDGGMQPLFYTPGSLPISIKNGTIVYRYSATKQNTNKSLISCSYGSSSGNKGPLATADTVYTPEITIKDANLIRVHDNGDFSYVAGNKLTKYSNAGPAITVKNLASDIKLIRSSVLSTSSSYGAISYAKNTYYTGAYPAGLTAVEHNLYLEDSIIGVPGGAKAIGGTTISGGLALACTLNVTAKGAVQFIGTDAISMADGGPAVNTTALGTLAESTPTLEIPDVAWLQTYSKQTTDVLPAYLAPAEYASNLYLDAAHKHAKQHFAEVPATTESEGLAEHYYCALCNNYLEADGETVTTKAALVIPMVACQHEELEAHAAVAPTFLAAGNSAYWSCAACGKFFSDEAAETEMEEGSWAIAKRATTDTEGLSDSQMVEFGAVAKTVRGDTVKAFTTLKAAYEDACTWTSENGGAGVVTLLCNYTMYDEAARNYSRGAISNVTASANAAGFTVHDNSEYNSKYGIDIKGFWLDLGGNTLVVRSGYAVFAGGGTAPFNVRNGRMIHQYTTEQRPNYATFCNGGADGNSDVGGPQYTFHNVEVIGAYANTNTGSQFININTLQSTINFIKSKVIVDRNADFIAYKQGTNTVTAAKSGAYKHVVNIFEDCVIGVTYDNKTVFTNATEGSGRAEDGIYLNIAEGANPIFLGSTFTEFSGTVEGKGDFVNRRFSQTDDKFTGYTMPDTTKFVDTTGPSAVFDLETSVSCNQLVEVAGDATLASFQANESAEATEMSVSAAFDAWKNNGYSGKITLLQDLNEEEASALAALIGNTHTCFGPWRGSGSAHSNKMTSLYLVGAEASNGNLTIDLNGHSVAINGGFIGTADDLKNFDLTVEGGTVTGVGIDPIFVLSGTDVSFKLDRTTLTRSSDSASYGWVINDTRYGGSYSILTNSTITSNSGAAIALVTTPSNISDASLLYYIKDCNLSGKYVNTYSPATICSLKTSDPAEYTTNASPVRSVILDNVTYPTGEGAAPLTNLSEACVRSVSNPPEEAVIAEISFGKLFSVKIDCIDERMALAEMLGRNAAETTTLKLLQNVTVDKSAPVGVTGVTSAFTVDFNGKKLEGEALIQPTGGAGTKVTINLTGELGNDDQMIKIFANGDENRYQVGDAYVIEKGRYFTNYSLNLEDNVTINLYTDGVNGMPAKVYYLLDGERNEALKGDKSEWMITELTAKEMGKTVDAYAFETVDGTTYVDFSTGISVEGYVNTNPGDYVEDEAEKAALNKTLVSMTAYGEYAKNFFGGNYNADVEGAPAFDNSNLDPVVERKVEGNMTNNAGNPRKEGYYGSSAVLEDEISLKLYFYGDKFENATAKVTIGNVVVAENVTLDENITGATGQPSGYYTVKTGVAAKNFDTAITVALTAANGDDLGSVTDSVYGYTMRIQEGDIAYKLARALITYGNDAKAYDAAKNAN